MTRSARIMCAQGLHARPAVELVRLVKSTDAEVTITGATGRAVDASSLVAVMAGGFQHGSDVVLTATGAGAEEVLDRVAALLARP